MKRNKAVILAGLATWAMLGVAHAVTNNAVTNGLLNAVDTWGVGSMPVAPDGNVWNANGFSLGVGSTNNTVETFYGSELVLPAGSALDGSAGWNLTLQAATFDGGSLIKNNNIPDDYDFSGQPITITENGASFESRNANHNINLKNGILIGSGDVAYTRTAPLNGGSTKLVFENSVNMDAYTGTISVNNTAGSTCEALLYIGSATNGSFSVVVNEDSRLAVTGTNTYASLVLGGETIPDGDYTTMAKFTLEQQGFLLNEGGTIIVGAGGAVEDKVKVAVQTGDMNEGATWLGGVAPVAGDSNVWVSAGYDIGFKAETFEGETLHIASGDRFGPSVGAAGADPTVRNLTLDGGRIDNHRNTPCVIDLSGSNLTITSNGGELRSNNIGRNIGITNGVLTGEGDLLINYTGATGQASIVFYSDTVLTNYTGMINVNAISNNATALAGFDGLTDGSFGINIAEGSRLDLRTVMTNYFDSVTFGTNSLAVGTYTTGQLRTLGYDDYILGNVGGTVVVVDNTPEPELWPAVLFVDSAAGNITISTTNLNADVRVTNALQVTDSLSIIDWEDLSSAVGVTETNWVIETTNSAFYQIESSY